MIQQVRSDLEAKIRFLHDDYGVSFRRMASDYGLWESDATMLHNIVSGKSVSNRSLRRIAKALDVPEQRRPYTPRPVTTKQQEQRRAALGVQWRDVIDAGLDALASKIETEDT